MEYVLHPYKTAQVKADSDIPWNIVTTNAPAFWPFARGVSPVSAGVDTGIDTSHSEFAGRIFMPRSLTGSPMTDTDGHGTHTAGTVIGATKGMIPWGRFMPLKVEFGTSKTGLQIIDALISILDHNKKAKDEDKVVVVNCSFSGGVDPIMHNLIRSLVESDVSVVCSAGNYGDGNPETHECLSAYPAYHWEVITAAAANQDGSPARFSSSYDGIDLAAPGVNIISAKPGGGFQAMSGTSMSAPHVTGAIALLKAAFRMKHKRWPTTEETEAMLWKCITPLPFDKRLIGRGLLKLPGQIITRTTKKADVAPFIKDGRTMGTFRFIGEAFGAEVDGSKLPKVSAQLGDRRIEMTIDSKDYAIEELLF